MPIVKLMIVLSPLCVKFTMQHISPIIQVSYVAYISPSYYVYSRPCTQEYLDMNDYGYLVYTSSSVLGKGFTLR